MGGYCRHSGVIHTPCVITCVQGLRNRLRAARQRVAAGMPTSIGDFPGRAEKTHLRIGIRFSATNENLYGSYLTIKRNKLKSLYLLRKDGGLKTYGSAGALSTGNYVRPSTDGIIEGIIKK
jgi:hypothetical protein